MKKIIVSVLAFIVVFGFASYRLSGNNQVSGDCTFKGKKLYGKVQVVTSFPDIKVQVVSSFPDLKVQAVNSFPDSCGKWMFVNSFPDFKIQYVNSFPDIKITMVNSFPGMN
jgi:hypothetical protein